MYKLPVIILSTIAAVFLAALLSPFKVLELRTLDMFFHLRGFGTAHSDVIIAGIDDKSLDEIREPYAFYGKFIAEAVKICAEKGAKVVAVDMLQPRDYVNKEFIDGNKKLKEAARRYNTVWAYRIYPKMEVSTFLDDLEHAGVVNLVKDIDGVARRQTLFFEYPINYKRKCFALKIFEQFKKSADENFNILGKGEIIINYAGPHGTFTTLSLIDVLKGKIDSALFKGKVVLIGDTSVEGQEFHATPFSVKMPGVELHANILQTLINSNPIIQIGGILGFGIIVVLAVSAALLFYKASPLTGAFWLFALCSLYCFASFVLFAGCNLKLEIIKPLMTLFAVYMSVFSYRLVTESREKSRVRQIFARYVSPGVVDEILSQNDAPVLTGEYQDLTVLFSDIANFTVISEKVTPEVLIRTLNEYLSEMIEIIFAREGTLDKFIGDGIMVFFGSPLSQTNHAERAVLTALDMIKKTDELSAKWANTLPVKFNIRIGIHTGPVIVGDIGSRRRKEYTVMGDNVNIASRLEQVNKEFGTRVMISEATHNFVKDRVDSEFLGERKVKGKDIPLKIYSVKGLQRGNI